MNWESLYMPAVEVLPSVLVILVASWAVYKALGALGNKNARRSENLSSETFRPQQYTTALDEKFDRICSDLKEIRADLRDIKHDMQNVRERLSTLEAETIVCNMIPDQNKRSEAAKRMWEKRKARTLTNK